MALVCCPHCGHASRDAEFCDACNREISVKTIAQRAAPTQIDLGGGQIVECPFLIDGWPDLDRSEPFEATWSQPRRGRLHAISPLHWPGLQSLIEERGRTKLSALPPIQIVPAEGGAIIIAEWWEHGNPLSSLPALTSPAELAVVLEAIRYRCRLYGQLMSELHDCGYVWLNFDPNAVEMYGTSSRITNLDTLLFRAGECPSRLRVSPRFSPPEVCRFQGERIGPSSDVFHLAIFAYYAFANLLPSGFPGRGLEGFGFKIPALRVYQPALPVGIWPVVARGLHVDPTARQQTVGEFLTDLEQAISQALRGQRNSAASPPSPTRTPAKFRKVVPPHYRHIETSVPRHRKTYPAAGPLVDVGQLTITGVAKAALGGVNQDTIAIETISIANRLVRIMMVADGVSVCRIGRGELASQLACRTVMEVIRSETAAVCSCPDWPTILQRACIEAGKQIVQAAIQELNGELSVADNDIMSTTAVIGVWDGDVLHVANAGDSRAYLVREGIAEQLTVDGDTGTSQLAMGTPPEQVQELGVAAKSLRYCLGACALDASGQLTSHPDRCLPTYSQWILSPGDTIVICSDGLVEEGVFLEPPELGQIVSANPDATASQLAELLVHEADHRQRPPSSREPSGFGDNIACVVLRCEQPPANVH